MFTFIIKMFVGFLFPLIRLPGFPMTKLPEVNRIQNGREPFYGDEIDYLKPKMSNFEFLSQKILLEYTILIFVFLIFRKKIFQLKQ